MMANRQRVRTARAVKQRCWRWAFVRATTLKRQDAEHFCRTSGSRP